MPGELRSHGGGGPAVHVAVNLLIGGTALACGAFVLWHLLPLLSQPADLQALLLVLPAKHGGLPPAAKTILFAMMLAAGAAMAAWGLWSLHRAARRGVALVNAALGLQFIMAFLLFEVGVRAAGALGAPLPGASYFANPACGEAYYRMVEDRAAHRWSQQHSYDPELGWTRPRIPGGDPDALVWPPARDDRPKIWFFGDSFIAGVREPSESIPARVEARLATHQALNYGVGGYGLDQIYLRYRLTADAIPAGSNVVVGVLTTDIDRSVLRYFGGFKPLFVATGNGFALVPPPPREALPALYDALPEPVFSYALAGLRSLTELVVTGFDRSETACERDGKTAVAGFLLDAIVEVAQSRQHNLHWIVFVPVAEFYKPSSWRYEFLKAALERKGQPYLDTMALLRALSDDRVPESYYIPDDGHLTAEGNDVVARALAARLWRNPTH